MKRLLILILATLCLCGCDFNRVRTEKRLSEYETDFSTVHVENISICGTGNSDFEDSINTETEKSIESELVAFETKSQDSKAELIMGNKCILEINWEEVYNKNSFISLVEEKYTYTGGARGSVVHIPKNIDLTLFKEIKLADLFSDSGYAATLNRMIKEQVSENPDEYKDLWDNPEIKPEHQTNFYIKDDDLIIFFQPYDLSYYSKGFVEFSFDLADLSGYLKEEYRRLIKMTEK